jgi:hypothetical protein
MNNFTHVFLKAASVIVYLLGLLVVCGAYVSRGDIPISLQAGTFLLLVAIYCLIYSRTA